jgi:hypothetical protein
VDPESPKSPALASPEADLEAQSPAPSLHDADLEAKQLMEDILAIDLPYPDTPTRQEHEHTFKATKLVRQSHRNIPVHTGLLCNNLLLANLKLRIDHLDIKTAFLN